jgi:steroid delta-isomerase-like uncharacterized protein
MYEEMLTLAKAHADAEDRRNVEETVATFTENCVYSINAFSLDIKGQEAVAKSYAMTFEAFPDFHNAETEYFLATNGDVFIKALVEFTHSSDWNGIPATGKKLSFWSLAHFPRAADGLFVGEHVHLNGPDFLYQIGALPSNNIFEVAAHIRKLEAEVADLEARLAKR